MKKHNMLKKICSFMLVSMMLFTAIPSSSLAAIESKTYLADSFEDWATNQVPTNSTYSGFNMHVVETGAGKKALYMEPDDNEMSINVSLPNVTDSFFFTVDLSVMGTISNGRLSLKGTGTSTSHIINITDNTLTTYNGKRGLPSLKEASTEITVHYDPERKRFDVYDGDKMVLSDWYVTNGPGAVNEISLSLETESYDSAKVLIEGVHVYSAACDNKKSFPSVTYSQVVSPWESQEYDSTPTTFVYKNFDIPSGGLNGFTVYTDSGAKMVDTGEETYYELRNTDLDYVSDVPFSGAGSKVMFEVMVKQGNPGAELRIMYVDQPNSFDQFLTITTSGAVIAATRTVGMLKEGEWNHIAVAVHCGRGTMDAYLNGKLVVKGIARRTSTEKPIKIRIARTKSEIDGDIKMDSLRIYSGNEIVELDDSNYTGISILGGDSAAIKNLAGKNGFHAYSKYIIVNGEKKMSETPAFKNGEVTYASVSDLAKMLGSQVIANDGSKDVTVGESSFALEMAAVSKYNAVYVPAKELLEKLGKQVLDYERGLLIFADEPMKYNDDIVRKMNEYMQFGRLTPDEISAIMKTTSHPRVTITPSDVERMQKAYASNDEVFHAKFANMRENLCYPERVVSTATSSNGVYWYNYAFSTGWLVTGEDYMKDKVWEGVKAACEAENWDTENDSLCRGHRTASVALAYDWLYDEWTDEQRALMEEKIIEFGLKPIEKVLKGTDASLTNVTAHGNNINAICISGAIMGAVAVYEKCPELASYIIAEGMRALEKVLYYFYPNGAWDEGNDYASYMIVYLQHGLSTIKSALGDDYGFLTAPGVSGFPMYFMSMQGNRGGNNYHDGSEWSLEQSNDGVGIAWGAHAFSSPEYYQLRQRFKALTGNSVEYPEDILYYYPEWEGKDNLKLPLDAYYGVSELFSMRSNYEKDGIYLSGHFGTEHISHSHYDGGTFVLDMLGERWALDLGKDDYTLPGYFITGTRDNYYRVRPEGHNTFVINPDLTMGHDYYGFGQVTNYDSNDAGAVAVADMTTVYTNSQSARRGFMIADNRQSVVIRDEIRTMGDSEIYWFMHTSAEIEVVDENSAILTKNGKQVRLDFLSNTPGAVIYEMDAVPLPTSPNPDGQNPNEGVRKVVIRVPNATNLDLTVRIAPANSTVVNNPVPDQPLDQWSAPKN